MTGNRSNKLIISWWESGLLSCSGPVAELLIHLFGWR
jgi:hypothetical protein